MNGLSTVLSYDPVYDPSSSTCREEGIMERKQKTKVQKENPKDAVAPEARTSGYLEIMA